MRLSLWKETQREMIIKTLEEQDGNLSRTAKKLGIGRTTLYRLLKQFNISIQRSTSVEVDK